MLRQPTHTTRFRVAPHARRLSVAVCLLALATLSAGCAAPWSRGKSLDNVTEAPSENRYPTAVTSATARKPAASATSSASTTTSQPATPPATASQPASAAATAETAKTPATAPANDTASKPFKTTPLQLPEEPQTPKPLPNKQDIPTPLPLAPYQRPNNFAVAVAPGMPQRSNTEGAPATEAAPSQPANPAATSNPSAPATTPTATTPQAEANPAAPASNPTPTPTAVLPPSADQIASPAAQASVPQQQHSATPATAAAALATTANQGFPASSVVPATFDAPQTPNQYSAATNHYPPATSALQSSLPAASWDYPVQQTAAYASTANEPTPAQPELAPQSESPSSSPGSEPPRPTLAEHRAALITAIEAEIRNRQQAKADRAEIARLELQLRLLYLLAERPDDAVAAIDSLSGPERESCKHLLFGLAALMADEPESRAPHRNAKVLRALRDATSELAAGSRLDLRNMTFCEKVEYFGWYTEFPRYEFTPKQQVILYVEVENFAAEAKGPQSFETELQGSYQIFDASGQIIAERQLPLDKEVCRNYRRDYFLAYRIYMPDQIAPGSYRLELTLEDLKARGQFQGRKLGQATIDFTIR